MQMPYGAVYFRKSNPPKEDWERDIAQAAKEGMNIFRHWFLWGAIEIKPGVFDWDDYDRQMDLAAKNGIKVIAAEMITSVPMWLFRRRPELFAKRSRGEALQCTISASCSTGNFASLCLNNAEARELAGYFLSELVKRYRGHDALMGYDVCNEGPFSVAPVFHGDTFRELREWLRRKYGSLDAVNKAWRRYSMADWEDVEPTDSPDQPIPEALDLWRFKKENFYDHVQWRIDLIRSLDPDHLIVAHGNPGFELTDHWLFAKQVDVYGYTQVASRHTNQPWRAWHSVDWTRAASRGKPFWHAEAQGGPLWMQPQLPGRRPEDGRISTAENVRIWNLVSLAGGARGILFTRWRGLLDPPLWDAFGLHSLDGSVNPRSEMASRMATWTNDPDQAGVMAAAPLRGELGILHLPESIAYHRMLFHAYPGREDIDNTLYGAYRSFFDMNVQADWVELADIDDYQVVYSPHGIQMSPGSAECLKKWVADGGVLISEACPGYFDEMGRAGPRQPALGLSDLFGAKESGVEFMPDLGDEIRFEYDENPVRGGLYRQWYAEAGGKGVGRFGNGQCAVVEHTYGKGRTLLIGSFPSLGYFRSQGKENRGFFEALLKWTGLTPRVTVSGRDIVARLHSSDNEVYLWVLNMSDADQRVSVTISEETGQFRKASPKWGEFDGRIEANAISAAIPAQDGLVLRLE